MIVFRVRNPKPTGTLQGVRLYNGILIRLKGNYFTPYFVNKVVMEKLIELYDDNRSKVISILKRTIDKFDQSWKEDNIEDVIVEANHPLVPMTVGVLTSETGDEFAKVGRQYFTIKNIITLFFKEYYNALNTQSAMAGYSLRLVKHGRDLLPLLALDNVGVLGADYSMYTFQEFVKELDKTNILAKPFKMSVVRFGVHPPDNPNTLTLYYRDWSKLLLRIHIMDKSGGLTSLSYTRGVEVRDPSEIENPQEFIKDYYNFFLPEPDGSLIVLEKSVDGVPKKVYLLPREFTGEFYDELKSRLVYSIFPILQQKLFGSMKPRWYLFNNEFDQIKSRDEIIVKLLSGAVS